MNYEIPNEVLEEIAGLTDANYHQEAREKIAEVVLEECRKRAVDYRLVNLIKTAKRTITDIYDMGEAKGGIDPEEFAVACKFTNIMLAVIGEIFGDEVRAAFNKVL